MKKTKPLYHGHRFPAVVISCAVRWSFRFSLSLCDVEELLLERGVVLCNAFGYDELCTHRAWLQLAEK
ncbi:hypothetical protein AB4Y38_43435, partial [Paraburkholderia sp. EG285A]